MLDVYTINRQTKALLCKQDSTYRTLIYEGSRKKRSIHSLKRILDVNCTWNGSTLDGRLKFAKYVLRTSQKLPIAVSPRKGIFMIPIRSIRSKKCGVISYYQIKKFQPLNEKSKTHILFKDGLDLMIDISFASFNRQYKKTGQLIANLLQPVDF